MSMSNERALRVGIICYPSVGGSGILASGLGDELAARGHEVHFVSYERPFRLQPGRERVFFHPVEISSYELFKYPDYTLPLSVKLAEVSQTFGLDILHAHYAVPHATAAILARSMLPSGQRPAVVTTLHGTDTTLLGRDPAYAPAIRYALESSDAVTAVSDFLRKETHRLMGVEREIEVIHNFFDARAAARYRGEVEPIDPVAGHIPGARNLPFTTNVDGDGRFLAPQQVRRTLVEAFDGVAPADVVFTCGSGVTACHLALASAWAGLEEGRIYVGSFSEWCRDPARAVATGPEPGAA